MKNHIQLARTIANFLDNSLELFGIRFGVSAVVGVIPEIGDVIDALLAFYLVWIGMKMQLPKRRLIQMTANIGVSLCIGLIPVLGDAGYLFYRPNLRNLKIIESYIHEA